MEHEDEAAARHFSRHSRAGGNPARAKRASPGRPGSPPARGGQPFHAARVARSAVEPLNMTSQQRHLFILAADKVLAYLARADFGAEALADVRG